jgi:hypothetical protein
MVEQIKVVKIPDGHIPQDIGQMSWHSEVYRPETKRTGEWQVKLPCKHIIALCEPTHQVFETDEKSAGSANHGITVHPSIVCPNGDWHGFIIYSRMTEDWNGNMD